VLSLLLAAVLWEARDYWEGFREAAKSSLKQKSAEGDF